MKFDLKTGVSIIAMIVAGVSAYYTFITVTQEGIRDLERQITELKLKAREPGPKGDPGKPGSDAAFPKGAVVAFDGGAYEKSTSERLSSGCPPGWVRFIQAEGRFILGSDSYPSSGETGEYELRTKDGSPTHTLRLNEIVNHTHGGRLVGTILTPGEGHLVVLEPKTAYERSKEHELIADNVTGHPFPGEAEPHNNMPPYVALYFCKKEG